MYNEKVYPMFEKMYTELLKQAKEMNTESIFYRHHMKYIIEQTKGSIGYNLVSRMPKGGCLVNTARKEVINEPELMKVLEEREDLKYIADVAPACIDELKAKFGNRVFATPKKMGAETAEANVNAGLAAANQIVKFFTEGCTKFQVNKF